MDVIFPTMETVDERTDTIVRVLEAVLPGAAFVLITKPGGIDQASMTTNLKTEAVKRMMDEAFTALQAYEAERVVEG